MIKIWIGLLLGAALSLPVVRAQQPYSTDVPTNGIAFFDRTTATGCPAGWAELTTARGFYLTGLTNGGTKATTVGPALTDQENRTHTHGESHTHTMAHTHTWSFQTAGPNATVAKQSASDVNVASAGHTHLYSGTTGASSQASTGAESAANTGTNSVTLAPYLQYLLCKKS